MEKDLILTIDAGTTGCKCSVFNVKGEALCAIRRDYSTQYPHPNWAEQDPDVIMDAICEGIRELLMQVKAPRIACIGLSPSDEGEGRADLSAGASARSIGVFSKGEPR